MSGDLAVLRRRLKFRSWHRGTREMDLILGRFADASLDRYDHAALDRYALLLEESDPDIYDWITGRAAPDDDRYHRVLADLARFHCADGERPS